MLFGLSLSFLTSAEDIVLKMITNSPVLRNATDYDFQRSSLSQDYYDSQFGVDCTTPGKPRTTTGSQYSEYTVHQ